MTAGGVTRPVLLAHAEGDEPFAERLAGPLVAAGYEVVHRGTVLVGESLMLEATRVLTAGGPVVLCGTIRAMGTSWAQQVVSAARALNPGVRVYGVQVERDANLKYLTFDTEVAAFWLDPDRAVGELLAALAKHYPTEAPTTSSPPIRDTAVEQRFCDLLLDACDIIDLANLPVDRHLVTRQLMLRSLFVPLKVRVEREAGRDFDIEALDALQRRRGSADDPDKTVPSPSQERPTLAPVGQRLQQSRRLVILGDPGSGKTTTLRWIATAYLLRLRGDQDWSALPAVDTLPDEGWLPILIRCRDLGPDQVGGTLEDMLVHVLRRAEMAMAEVDVLKQIVSHRLDGGTALLLIDGLDEITDPGARARFCRQLEQVHLAHPNAPVIATSRIVGYREMGYRIGRGFEHVTIAELSRSDKDDFIRRWCAVTEPPSRQQTVAAGVIADIHSTDRIERLTNNPMLLTTMALVKRKIGKLPEHRAELYREAVQVLLNWRAEVDEPIDHHEAVPQLEYIAYAMSDRGVQQLTDDEIVTLLEQMRVEYPNVHAIHRRPASQFIRLLERRTGILNETGHVRQPARLAPIFEFRHLTFQEYLTALALVQSRFPGRDSSDSLAMDVAPLAGRLGDGTNGAERAVTDTWQESIRLCVSLCHGDDVDRVLNAILSPCIGEDPVDTAGPRAILAAHCLEDEPNAGETTVDNILRQLTVRLPLNEDRSNATKTVLTLVSSRWASRLLHHMVRELRARGERAVPYLGRLCGEAIAKSAPQDDNPPSVWQATQLDALNSPVADDVLCAALAIGNSAPGDNISWSSAADRLLDLITIDDAVLAAAATWALTGIREGRAALAWQPTDEQINRILAAGRPQLDSTRMLSLVTAAGPRRWTTIEPIITAARNDDPVVRTAAVRVLGQTSCETAVEPLTARLDDSVPQVRAAAARALGELRSRTGFDPLLQRLSDSDPAVRSALVEALGDLQDTRAVAPLLEALDDPVETVRGKVAFYLGWIGDGRAVAPLVARFPQLDGQNAWPVAYAMGCLGDDRCVEPLVARLGDESDILRGWVAYALGDLGDARAYEALVSQLDDKVGDVRRGVVRALGSLGDARALSPVARMLGDSDPGVRAQAADALATLGDDRTLTPILTALSDSDAVVRSRVAAALGKIGSTQTREPLVALLGDTDVRVRGSAAESLGRLKNRDAFDALVAMLYDAQPHVRGKAAAGLATLGEVRAVEPLVGVLDDPVASVREQAARALGGLDDRRCLPALRRRLIDPDPDVRTEATAALARLGDGRSLTTLVRQLRARDPREREFAGWGLGQLGDARAIEPLSFALRDPHPRVRRWAAWALSQLDSDLVVDPLLAELDDDHPTVRQEVVEALGTVGHPRSVRPLLACLDDPHPGVRSKVVEALGDIGTTEAVDQLLLCLDDIHPDVRKEATWTLGRLDDGRAVTPLLARLNDPRPQVCRGAAWGLGLLGDPRAVPHLEVLLDSPNGGIRLRAVEALARLAADNVLSYLVRALGDPYPAVRAAAAWELRHCVSDAAEQSLLSSLNDHDRHVRGAAAMTLGAQGNRRALGPLLACLNDPTSSVRGRAAIALGRLGTHEAREPLQHAVADSSPWVSARAAWALGLLGDTSGAQVLRACLPTTSRISRRIIVAVLSRLGDRRARHQMRTGLSARAAPTRRKWVGEFAWTEPDQLDRDLLSRDGDGHTPFLDALAIIDDKRIERMARTLRLAPSDVRRRYTSIATMMPLRLI